MPPACQTRFEEEEMVLRTLIAAARCAAPSRRMRRTTALGPMALAGLLAACSQSPTAPSGDLPAEIELRQGQSAAVRGTELTLTLVAHRSDCGPNELCLAANFAVVSASVAGTQPFGLAFQTDGRNLPQPAGPYVVELVRVIDTPDGRRVVVRVDRP
jgi:hypothetical protein